MRPDEINFLEPVKKVPDEKIKKASEVDLYNYLVNYHPEDFVKEGENYLRYSKDHSIVIKRGNTFWQDFGGHYKNKNGGKYLTNIHFLVNVYGMRFEDAVEELLNNGSILTSEEREEVMQADFSIPEPDKDAFKNLYAYLVYTRHIPKTLVQKLISSHLIYQTTSLPKDGKARKNIVFINKDKDYVEYRGTISNGGFHRCAKEKTSNYWSICNGEPKVAYVCEGAIDAISLFALHSYAGKAKDSIYIGIGGCSNYKTIDRIIEEYPIVVLALDNDGIDPTKKNAAEETRKRYPNLPSMLPTNKDWNDDLVVFMTRNGLE